MTAFGSQGPAASRPMTHYYQHTDGGSHMFNPTGGPHLGLSSAGYGGGISGGYYNHFPAYPPHTLSNFTQPNPYPPPHHHQFVQTNPYSPPQHNHSAFLTNGHLLPQQFPACSQPIHPIAQHPTHHSPQPNTNLWFYPPISPISSAPVTSHQQQTSPVSNVKLVEPDHHLGSMSTAPSSNGSLVRTAVHSGLNLSQHEVIYGFNNGMGTEVVASAVSKVSPHETLGLSNHNDVIVVSGSNCEDGISIGISDNLNQVINRMDDSIENRESEFQVTEGMDNVMWKTDSQSHFKHCSLVDGSYVGGTLLGSEAHTYTDVGEKLGDDNIDTEDCGIQVFNPDITVWTAVLYRYCKLGQFQKATRVLNDVIKRCFGSTLITDNGSLNGNVGKEGLFAGDGNEKGQVISKKELDLLLEKWKARATAETQSQSKLVQWFILCLQLCHCAKKDRKIGIFCKQALHRFGGMTQTSLSQKRVKTIKLMFDGNWEIWKFWVIAAENGNGIKELHAEPFLAELGFKFFCQKLPQSFLPSVSVLIMGGTLTGWELLHRECYTVLKSINCETLKVILVEWLITLEPWMLVVVSKAMLYTSCVKEVCASHLLCKRNVTTFDQVIEALMSTENDQACDFGSGPLFNILPLLIQLTFEDQERHLLVKVIDKMLYELAELGPYVHKFLVVIALLIIEDYYARFVGIEMMSKLGITSAIILSIFLENLYAEIIAGIIWNKQNVGDYLSWIYMYGKLTQNPNHYNLHEVLQCHFSDYLSELVDITLSSSESSKCVSKEVDIDLLPLNSVLIASRYFLSGSKTCELMMGDISTALEDNLVCYCDGIMIQLLRHFSNSQSYQFVKPLTFSCLDDPHLAMILYLWEFKAGLKSMEYLPFEYSDYPTSELICIFLGLGSTLSVITGLAHIVAAIALGVITHGDMLQDKVFDFSTDADDSLDVLLHDLGDDTLAAPRGIDSTILVMSNTSAAAFDNAMASQPVNMVDCASATLLGTLLIFGTLLIYTIEFHISVSLVGCSGHVVVPRRGEAATQWLIQWLGTSKEEATWEFAEEVQTRFPEFEF